MIKLSKKNQALVDAVYGASVEQCQDMGGYPCDVEVVGEHLVIASAEGEGEPVLYSYPLKEAHAMLKEARRLMAGDEAADDDDKDGGGMVVWLHEAGLNF